MNILNILKAIALRFIDLLVIVLTLAVGVGLLGISGAFISNIANCIIAGQYWNISLGTQAALVILALLWLPILIINIASREPRRR